MRDGIDYEFTIVFDINMKHQAIASKDRTNLLWESQTLQLHQQQDKLSLIGAMME